MFLIQSCMNCIQVQKLSWLCRLMKTLALLRFEAMAAGCPVIAANAAGYKETVTKETGVFVDRVAVEEVVKTVEKMEKKKAKFSVTKLKKHAGKVLKIGLGKRLRSL